MASSPLNLKTLDSCSISLPARSNPLTLRVEEKLTKLKASQATSKSPSPSFICQNLAALRALYNQVDELIQFPLNQEDKCASEMVDGSLVVLDVCETTRDVLSEMKEKVEDLQSALQRKRGYYSSLVSNIVRYRASKKKVIRKCLEGLKRIHNRRDLSSLQNKDQHAVDIIRLMREIEEISSLILGSILSYIAGPKAQPRSFLYKLIPKCVGCTVENQADLGGFQSNIEDLEEGLNGLFRCLIKTRVSLLNSLNQ